MTVKILVVEDEKEISDLIEMYLLNEGFEVIMSETGEAALTSLNDQTINLAILDVMLPDYNGFDLCADIRKKYLFPIIMLTAKNTEMDKIHGLTVGADDYVTKPFQPLELMARVKAQLRRDGSYNSQQDKEAGSDDFESRGLKLQYANHQCFVNGHEVNLTPKEFAIIAYLTQHQGQVISSEALFQNVWGESYYEASTNTIMVHIRHIRDKIKAHSPGIEYIKTVWGVGYKFDE
ncbi:response regulator transcription factor [Vagococcus coleopterorum]|uniref:Response regulator transcription factor n=1 Tax=Vagococcus coleopterorum TaxID=2714946 RepID=A0A6G8APK2_9ENTE|nr:response regulator transcription factor [Vagococcus coleopterorum]QIL46872.1 response regulator transcription factor [Vagococcus coleopterorum]